ncbi:restriction endonuclease subunit S [Prevotella sp. PCJ2]|nr:restriction endonuclease subunit S [Prevotella sp. PCJ2]
MRFPGFTDKWKRIKVSELLDFYSTNSLSWDMLNYDGGEIKNLHYGLIHSGLPTLVDVSKDSFPFVNEASTPKKYTLCKEGDVAFADASEDTNEVGKVVEFLNTNGENIISGLHTIHGRDKSDMTVTGFKGYAFSSMPFHHQIRRIAQGTKIYSISTKTFDEVYIGVPTKDEQAKIARLLQLLDERIATQNKIIEDLKKLKSAISAQLYEGHYITDNSNGWKIVRLGDITENFSIRNKNSGSYPMYSVTNTSGFSPQHEVFEGKEIKDEDISIYKIIHKGEFAYNPARINVGSIGRYDGEAPCMISSLYVCFRPTAEVDSDWLLYYLQSAKKIYQYGIFGEGGVRIYLFYPNFSRIEALLPPLKVQKEIASILKSFNRKIKLDELLLSKYQEQKKFLLSNMFI